MSESTSAISKSVGVITATLANDEGAYFSCSPSNQAEAFGMIRALSQLCARMITASASTQDKTPLECWQAGTLARASHPSSN